MSVLIKGMEIPTNCESCRFWYQDQDSEHNVWNRCTALNHKEIIPFITERREDCPLVEIPSYGRLINAADLLKTITENAYLITHGYNEIEYGMTYFGIMQAINEQPTIIEAREGESDERTD